MDLQNAEDDSIPEIADADELTSFRL
jgi:hypothetical protein